MYKINSVRFSCASGAVWRTLIQNTIFTASKETVQISTAAQLQYTVWLTGYSPVSNDTHIHYWV